MLICSVRFESNALKCIIFLENRMFQSIGKEKRKNYRFFVIKVEKILKGSLNSFSPSLKIQIMSGKVCLKCEGRTLLGVVNKLFKIRSLLTIPCNVLPLHLKQTFRPYFEFSLKVIGSNASYFLKNFSF